MMFDDAKQLIDFDQRHVWHPYSSMVNRPRMLPVVSASGVRLRLADGRELVDGMASWWSAIHGYNHPELNQAVHQQVDVMAHVMFGGLTHPRAAELSHRLLSVAPPAMDTVFLADSGSVAVEVAIKLAMQYWQARGLPAKQRLMTVRRGYHGDTTGAMSVCDPQRGMHHLFSHALPDQLFADAPTCRFGEKCSAAQIDSLAEMLRTHRDELAAVILEPIVQGAGGMRFYSADYLSRVRQLCEDCEVLLILDEIATGFGRTGKYFASEHAGVSADILCVGKALTGGYMTQSATLTTREVSDTISGDGSGIFMHGPTFMANPLACAVASASLQILESGVWRTQVAQIERVLEEELAPCSDVHGVADVRVLGGIGVIEFHQPIDVPKAQAIFVGEGVWLRPFGNLLYTMPPYIIEESDLRQVASAMRRVTESTPF